MENGEKRVQRGKRGKGLEAGEDTHGNGYRKHSPQSAQIGCRHDVCYLPRWCYDLMGSSVAEETNGIRIRQSVSHKVVSVSE